jgi:hypothetical protein
MRFRNHLFVLVTVLASACTSSAISAEVYSTTWMLPGCQAYLTDKQTIAIQFRQGVCIGIVEGISYRAAGVCYPDGINQTQILKAVVQYVEERPARHHENFKAFVSEALRGAWPCKK